MAKNTWSTANESEGMCEGLPRPLDPFVVLFG